MYGMACQASQSPSPLGMNVVCPSSIVSHRLLNVSETRFESVTMADHNILRIFHAGRHCTANILTETLCCLVFMNQKQFLLYGSYLTNHSNILSAMKIYM